MVQARDAIAAARKLMEAGTGYDEVDCIGLIVTLIRGCPGGVRKYRVAGTNTLWKSARSAARYRDLTYTQEGIQSARPGMLAFMRHGDDVDHVGLVSYHGWVLHSSKSRGGVVETRLRDNGWNLLAVHRYIATEEEEGRHTEGMETARVQTDGGRLRIRSGPGLAYGTLGSVPNGTMVEILEDGEWPRVRANGLEGYLMGEFLIRQEPDVETVGNWMIMDDGGNVFIPEGGWRVTREGLD